jgi:hypothetical protein
MGSFRGLGPPFSELVPEWDGPELASDGEDK